LSINSLEKEFEQRIKESQGLIYKICRMYTDNTADRQDLFQEIVIQLWKAYPKYQGRSKFSTWLYRVAINTAITGLRRQKDFIASYEPATLPTHHAEKNDLLEEAQVRLLYDAIRRLDEIDRALVMLYLEDRSYIEMEEILGISSGALRVRMSRVKDKLRQLTKTI
jgi:RNA polymerase sigma-70 factor, ECF subfamily